MCGKDPPSPFGGAGNGGSEAAAGGGGGPRTRLRGPKIRFAEPRPPPRRPGRGSPPDWSSPPIPSVFLLKQAGPKQAQISFFLWFGETTSGAGAGDWWEGGGEEGEEGGADDTHNPVHHRVPCPPALRTRWCGPVRGGLLERQTLNGTRSKALNSYWYSYWKHWQPQRALARGSWAGGRHWGTGHWETGLSMLHFFPRSKEKAG